MSDIKLLSPKLTKTPVLFDRWLLFSVIALMALGILMVTSASIVISEKQFGHGFYYVTRQGMFLLIGIVLGLFTLRLDIEVWERFSPFLLLLSVFLLLVVLIPGLGRTVNGSTRWLRLGWMAFQVSELAKLSMLLYLAGYLVRHEYDIKHRVVGFLKPMGITAILGFLLLLEPDYGATLILFSMTLGLLFLAGAKPWQFIVLVFGVVLIFGGLAITSPYRMQRLTTFLNPWASQFASGYQLTQSLIAFGRGGLLGVGLGGSVQKLFYLPEAHTDFLFAVLAEELGLLGELMVVLLFVVVIFRIFCIAYKAYQLKRFYAAYVAYGAALWLGLQASINIGVNAGLCPTKGLTLPFMSYGGSSMLILCILIGIVLRIDYENRFEALGSNFVATRGLL
jgi:cell division protein FtsW